jgi:hypothetical protein
MTVNDREPEPSTQPSGDPQRSSDPYDPERTKRDSLAAEQARRMAFRPPGARPQKPPDSTGT